jgi:hypothetical protein
MVFGVDFKEGNIRELVASSQISIRHRHRTLRKSCQNEDKTQHDRNLQGLSLLAPPFLRYYNALLMSRMYFRCRK